MRLRCMRQLSVLAWHNVRVMPRARHCGTGSHGVTLEPSIDGWWPQTSPKKFCMLSSMNLNATGEC